jgi:hypothetical protein
MNHPHSHVFVCSITDFVEPVNHSAGIHFTSWNEKNARTRATSRPCMPGRLESVLTKTQSLRECPPCQEGQERMCSVHMPPIPLKSLGA